jgi:hypothetical protein
MFKHNEGKVKATRTDIKTPCVGSSAGAVKEVLPREKKYPHLILFCYLLNVCEGV